MTPPLFQRKWRKKLCKRSFKCFFVVQQKKQEPKSSRESLLPEIDISPGFSLVQLVILWYVILWPEISDPHSINVVYPQYTVLKYTQIPTKIDCHCCRHSSGSGWHIHWENRTRKKSFTEAHGCFLTSRPSSKGWRWWREHKNWGWWVSFQRKKG